MTLSFLYHSFLLVHPSLFIGDADGDGLDYTLADDELVVSCGCSVASPSPISVASSPSPVVANPQPSPLTPTCGEGDSFSIVSGDFPETEGCFLDTTTISNDNVVYTPSGTSDYGQVFVAATEVTAEDGTSSVSAIKCRGSNYAWVIVLPVGLFQNVRIHKTIEG